MREDLLQFIWKSKAFDLANLTTICGLGLTVLDFGTHNTNAGPDFLNAKIRLDKKIWSGHIEIHVLSSHWSKHGHQNDEKYNPVILHVVLDADCNVFNKNNTKIPQLVLKNRISPELIQSYEYLEANQHWIPCEKMIREKELRKFPLWMQRLTIARLETKVESIEKLFHELKGDWEQLLFIKLSQSFGLKINTLPFEDLAKSIKIGTIRKHLNSLSSIEAILFGQSGLLPNQTRDPYILSLKKEYDFLKHKYNLKPISRVQWNFLRLRPANFPSVRIAQLAQLVFSTQLYLSDIIDKEYDELNQLFKSVQPSIYWLNHYIFEKESTNKIKRLGKARIELIFINCIVPLFFFYGKKTKQQIYCDRAIDLLEKIKPELNSITKNWKNLGIKAQNAADSQALIHLKNDYCNQKRCTHCSIGHSILYNS